MAIYTDRTEIFREYADLEDEDLKGALAFSAANLDDRVTAIDVS